MYKYLLLFLFLSRGLFADESSKISEASGDLRLSQVLALTLAHSPELGPYSWDVRIAEAQALQASAIPNPELGIDIENALGSGALSGFDAVEETLSLSQTIELGRKRAKRKVLAAHVVNLAQQGYVLKRAEVLNSATKAFYDVLAAQEETKFAAQSLAMQKELSDAQEARVEAGKLSESEREGGRAALALAKIAADNADAEVLVARSVLGAFWGSAKPRFSKAVGQLTAGSSPPSYQSYQSALAASPVLAYHAEQLRRHQAAIVLEEANAVPDLTVGLGARHFEESNANAAVISFSVPLPIFDQKRGDIAKARAELSKAEAEKRGAKASLEAALVAVHARLLAAYQEATAVGATLLPAAQRGYDFANEGYKLGKFSFLELQAAQETLIDARRRQMGSRIRFHKAKADLETLAGRTH